MLRLVLALSGALLALAAPARADFYGIFEFPSPARSDYDLLRLNATTGEVRALPSGVNTAADELHPALSPDAKRMVFTRRDDDAGTLRIVETDLATGQSADLFNGLEVASEKPSTPVFSADGSAVLTGRPLQGSGSPFRASLTSTSVSAFPAGPFPHTVLDEGATFSSPGRSLQPAVGPGGLLAFTVQVDSGLTSLVVKESSGTMHLSTAAYPGLQNATFSQSLGAYVYVDRTQDPLGRLGFVSLSNLSAAGTILPAVVNKSNFSQFEPQFDSSGRYLAFVRRTPPGEARRLFVWDTQTQLLLNDAGVPLSPPSLGPGYPTADRDGAVAVQVIPVFSSTLINPTQIIVKTVSPTNVGILVERIVGRTTVLGHRAPKLRLVGRVPLGHFSAGAKHRIRWDQKVDGHKLRPGRYLITPRAVTKTAQVLDLGKPTVVRIR